MENGLTEEQLRKREAVVAGAVDIMVISSLRTALQAMEPLAGVMQCKPEELVIHVGFQGDKVDIQLATLVNDKTQSLTAWGQDMADQNAMYEEMADELTAEIKKTANELWFTPLDNCYLKAWTQDLGLHAQVVAKDPSEIKFYRPLVLSDGSDKLDDDE